MINKNLIPDLSYSTSYKDEAFYLWYRSSRPSITELQRTLPLDERGRKPHVSILTNWKNVSNWDAWADGLDAKVSDQLDMTVVEERIQMYKKHAEMGQQMSDKGMEYLNTKGIESDSSAIRAIVEGIGLEGKNRGMAEALTKVFAFSESALDAEIKKLLTSKNGEDGIIDLEPSDIVEEPNG